MAFLGQNISVGKKVLDIIKINKKGSKKLKLLDYKAGDVFFPTEEKDSQINQKNLCHNKKSSKNNQKNNKYERHFLLKSTVLFLGIIILASMPCLALVYQKAYAGTVMTNASLFGENLHGKNPEEIKDLIDKNIENYKITIVSGDFVKIYSLEDLEVKNNAVEVVKRAISFGRSGHVIKDNFVALKELLNYYLFRSNGLNLDINFEIDEKVIDQEIANIVGGFSKTDNIVITAFDSIAHAPNLGEEFYAGLFTFQLSKSLNQMGVVVNEDSIFSEEFLNKVKAIVNRSISIKGDGKKFGIQTNEIARMLSFDVDLNPYLDEKKVREYISSDIEPFFNMPVTNKKVRVENQAVEVEETPGKSGLAVDKELLKNSLIDAIVNDKSTVAVKMKVVDPGVDKSYVIVPNWEKKIDVNLTAQTMIAYEKMSDGNYQEVGSWKVTTGKNSTPTPIGTSYVMDKTPVTRMTGGVWGVDYYNLPNVHWVTYFRAGGYAIHEAYWRSSFGGGDYVWSGSRGCVNSSISVAKFIYDWAPLGTPVVVY